MHFSPVNPEQMDWSSLYPDFSGHKLPGDGDSTDQRKQCVEFADVGCGYGGLLGKCIICIFLIYLYS